MTLVLLLQHERPTVQRDRRAVAIVVHTVGATMATVAKARRAMTVSTERLVLVFRHVGALILLR